MARTAPDLVFSGGYTLRPRAEAGVSGLSSAERFRSEAFSLPSPSRKGGQHMGGASACGVFLGNTEERGAKAVAAVRRNLTVGQWLWDL